MARRMSNRDRIDQMRAEADAAQKERDEKRAAAPARAPSSKASSSRERAAAASAGKVRLVWSVRNQRGDEVSFFPYPQQAEARAEAERLAEETERAHFVTQAEKPA